MGEAVGSLGAGWDWAVSGRSGLVSWDPGAALFARRHQSLFPFISAPHGLARGSPAVTQVFLSELSRAM